MPPPPTPPPAVMLPCAVIEQLQRASQPGRQAGEARRGERAESSKRQPPSPPSPPPLTPWPPRHPAQSASSMPRALLTLPSRVGGGKGADTQHTGESRGPEAVVRMLVSVISVKIELCPIFASRSWTGGAPPWLPGWFRSSCRNAARAASSGLLSPVSDADRRHRGSKAIFPLPCSVLPGTPVYTHRPAGGAPGK